MKPQFRYMDEPALASVSGCDWANKMVLNPAIIKDPVSDRIHMLFRATGPWPQKENGRQTRTYPIFLGYATSDDLGKTWNADFSWPALAPALGYEEQELYTTDFHGNQVRHSRYVFGSDVAYDWSFGLDDVEHDTLLYKDDHLDEFTRKNARLRFSYAPQEPTAYDTQTMAEYIAELNEFNRRKKYIDGLHVNDKEKTFLPRLRLGYVHLWTFHHWKYLLLFPSRFYQQPAPLGQLQKTLCNISHLKNSKKLS